MTDTDPKPEVNQIPFSLEDLLAEAQASVKKASALKKAGGSEKTLLRQRLALAEAVPGKANPEALAPLREELLRLEEAEWVGQGHALLLRDSVCLYCFEIERTVEGFVEKQAHRTTKCLRWRAVSLAFPPPAFDFVTVGGETPLCLDCLQRLRKDYIPGMAIPTIAKTLQKAGGLSQILAQDEELEGLGEVVRREAGLGREVGEFLGNALLDPYRRASARALVTGTHTVGGAFDVDPDISIFHKTQAE